MLQPRAWVSTRQEVEVKAGWLRTHTRKSLKTTAPLGTRSWIGGECFRRSSIMGLCSSVGLNAAPASSSIRCVPGQTLPTGAACVGRGSWRGGEGKDGALGGAVGDVDVVRREVHGQLEVGPALRIDVEVLIAGAGARGVAVVEADVARAEGGRGKLLDDGV